jgi:hypothetical protein
MISNQQEGCGAVSSAPEDGELRWFKSTRSAGNGACVEVAFTVAGEVAVRDSKDPDGPMLRFGGEAWQSFVDSVRTGAFE